MRRLQPPTPVNKRERGYALIFLMLSMMAVVPAVGLGIDVSILYTVKAKLTAACDGASLAAARNLNLGLTMSVQAATAKQRAQSFYEGNYPQNYLGSTRLPATIDVPVVAPGQALKVTTTGYARTKTFFMALLGVPSVNVSATGTASRRSLNLMLVLDRSSSMSTQDANPPKNTQKRVDAMKEAAKAFVDQFSAMDTLGLIYFGSDSVLAFPPSPTYQTASPNLKYYIDQITAGDNTATSLAYWHAYQQLVNLAQPLALNAIVLFTDGIPNGVYASFPKKTITDTRYDSANPSSTISYGASPCTDLLLTGVVTQTSGFAAKGNTVGFWKPYGLPSSNHAASTVKPPNCASNTETFRIRQDAAYIPDTDALGNKIRNYGYDYITFHTNDHDFNNNSINDFQPGYPTQIRVDSPWVIGQVTKNTLDHAGIRVRNRALNANIAITTFVIGFGGALAGGGDIPDDTLMKRLANVNDPANTIFVDDPNVPDGKYYQASSSDAVYMAFQQIASEVLRLSR